MAFGKGQNGGSTGRPKKSKAWKIAEQTIRDLLPGLLMMSVEAVEKMLNEKPTLGFVTVVKFIKERPAEVVARFIPEAWADEPIMAEEIAVELIAKLKQASQPNANSATA